MKGNILLYRFTPLVICAGNNAEGNVLWCNPAPNSALTQRPIAIIGAKEDRDQVLRILIPQIETEITEISLNGFLMQFLGTDVHVFVNSSLCMFDDKMKAALQGTGGAYCQMCIFSKVNCHQVDYVVNGFPVDRTIENMHTIFSMLYSEGELPVTVRADDS